MPAYASPHPRSLALSTMKGGTGKTSISTNIAALTAERGYRVLLVDIDPQGNASVELTGPGTDNDRGEALVEAIMFNRQLRVLQGVRPNLDLVVGGEKADLLAYLNNEDRTTQMTALRRVLEPLHDDYDLIIIDNPPLVRPLREMGLAAARYLLVPTRPDAGSLEGVSGVARDFARVREVNPDLELLGVILFAVGSSSKALRHQVRTEVSEGLGQVAPVFETVVRYVEAPATNSRNSGLAVHEYARKVAAASKFTERKKSVSASKLAGDYIDLTMEILAEIDKREQRAAAPAAQGARR